MKLIDERARENHQREKTTNGLIIHEAYYGDTALIDQLTQQSNKAAWLFRHKVPGHLLMDVTTALRFQVQNSSLLLRREEKSYLVGIGSLAPEVKDSKMFILYSLGGHSQ